MAPIEKGSLVLVTGANGYIGSHIVDQLLQLGYRVRGTVRTEAKGQWLREYADKKYGQGKLDLVVVPDMGVKGAFDQAVKGIMANSALRLLKGDLRPQRCTIMASNASRRPRQQAGLACNECRARKLVRYDLYYPQLLTLTLTLEMRSSYTTVWIMHPTGSFLHS